MLTAGDLGQAEIIVQSSDTAKVLALSSEDSFPEVFATSRMIALMELAAATPVGGRVRAVAAVPGEKMSHKSAPQQRDLQVRPRGCWRLGAAPVRFATSKAGVYSRE